MMKTGIKDRMRTGFGLGKEEEEEQTDFPDSSFILSHLGKGVVEFVL